MSKTVENLINQIQSMIQDPEMGDDAWADYYLRVAIDSLEQTSKVENVTPILDVLHSMQGTARQRLLQVVTGARVPAHAKALISYLTTATTEEAEVILGELRTWELDKVERHALKTTSNLFRGRTNLLDRVINDI